jgi:hypothetical protein
MSTSILRYTQTRGNLTRGGERLKRPLSVILAGVEVCGCARFSLSHQTLKYCFAGKTVCLGTRLAKVELKLVTAMFILGFQHSVVDKSGAPLNPLPTPNWNDILFARPQQGSFIKYERTSLPL